MSMRKKLTFGAEGIENIDSNIGDRNFPDIDNDGRKERSNNHSTDGLRSVRWNVAGADVLSKEGHGHDGDGPFSKIMTTVMTTPRLPVRSGGGTPGRSNGNHTNEYRFSHSNTNDAIASYYFEGMPYTPFSLPKKKKAMKGKGRDHASLGARNKLTPGRKAGQRLEEMDQDSNSHDQEYSFRDMKSNHHDPDTTIENESVLENTFTLGNTADIASIYAMSTDPNATGIHTADGSEDESIRRDSIGNSTNDSNNFSNVSSEVEDALNVTTLSDPHELSTSNFILGTKARNLLKGHQFISAVGGEKNDKARHNEQCKRDAAAEEQAKEEFKSKHVLDGEKGENDNDDLDLSFSDQERSLPLSSPTGISFLSGSSNDASAIMKELNTLIHGSISSPPLSPSLSVAKKSSSVGAAAKGNNGNSSLLSEGEKATKQNHNIGNKHIKSPIPESPDESSIMNESSNDTSLMMKELNGLMFSGEDGNTQNSSGAAPEEDATEETQEDDSVDGDIFTFTAQLKASGTTKKVMDEAKASALIGKPNNEDDDMQKASLEATCDKMHDNCEDSRRKAVKELILSKENDRENDSTRALETVNLESLIDDLGLKKSKEIEGSIKIDSIVNGDFTILNDIENENEKREKAMESQSSKENSRKQGRLSLLPRPVHAPNESDSCLRLNTNQASPTATETIAAKTDSSRLDSGETINKSISSVCPSPFFNFRKKHQPRDCVRNSFVGDVSKIRKLTASIRKEKEELRAKRARMSLPVSSLGAGQKKGSALQRGRFSFACSDATVAGIIECAQDDELGKENVSGIEEGVDSQSDNVDLKCRGKMSMNEQKDNNYSAVEKERKACQENSSPAEIDSPVKVSMKRNHADTFPSFSVVDSPAGKSRGSKKLSLPHTPPKKPSSKSPNKSLESMSIDLDSPATNTRGAKAQLSPSQMNSTSKITSTNLPSFAAPLPPRKAHHSLSPPLDSLLRPIQSDLLGNDPRNSDSKKLQDSSSETFAFNLLTDSNLESFQQSSLTEHSELRKPVLGLKKKGSPSVEQENDEETPSVLGEGSPSEPSTTFASLSSTSLSKEYPFLKIGSDNESPRIKFSSIKTSPMKTSGKTAQLSPCSEATSTIIDPGKETLMLSDLVRQFERENPLKGDSNDGGSKETFAVSNETKRRRDTADSAILSNLLAEVDNFEKGATEINASPTNYDAARTPRSSSRKRLKGILNSSHKKDCKHRIARRIVAFGSPEAAEYNVGSPSISMTPMHPKSVKEKYRVPTALNYLEEEDCVGRSFSPSSHIMSNFSKQDSPRADESAESEAGMSGLLTQHGNSSIIASIDGSVIENADSSMQCSSRDEETARLEGDLSALICSTKKSISEAINVGEHCASLEETAELEGGLSVLLGKRSDEQLHMAKESLPDDRETENLFNVEETVELERNITCLIAGTENCPFDSSNSQKRHDITVEGTTELEGDMTRLIAQGSDPSLMESIDESRIEIAPELECEDALYSVHGTQVDRSNLNGNDQIHDGERTVELETNIFTLVEGNFSDEEHNGKICSPPSTTRGPLDDSREEITNIFTSKMLSSPTKNIENRSVGSGALNQHKVELERNVSSLLRVSDVPPGNVKTNPMAPNLSPKGRQSDGPGKSDDLSCGGRNTELTATSKPTASHHEPHTVLLDSNLGDFIASQFDNSKADESFWSNRAERSIDSQKMDESSVFGDNTTAKVVEFDACGDNSGEAVVSSESQYSKKGFLVDATSRSFMNGDEGTRNLPQRNQIEKDNEISIERYGVPILSPCTRKILPNALDLDRLKTANGNERILACIDASASDQHTTELEGNISSLMRGLGTEKEEAKTIQIDGAMASLLLKDGMTTNRSGKSEDLFPDESHSKPSSTPKSKASQDEFNNIREKAGESSWSSLAEQSTDSQKIDERSMFGDRTSAKTIVLDGDEGIVGDAAVLSRNFKKGLVDTIPLGSMNGNGEAEKLLCSQKQHSSLRKSSHQDAFSTCSRDSNASGISYLRFSKSDDTVSELGMHTSNEFSKTSSELSQPIAEESFEPVDLELEEILQIAVIDPTHFFRSECDAFMDALDVSADCRYSSVKRESESLILQICEDIERQIDECRSDVERRYTRVAKENEDILRTLQRISRACSRDGYSNKVYSQIMSGFQVSRDEAIGHMRRWLCEVTSIYNDTLSTSVLRDLEQEIENVSEKINVISNLHSQLATVNAKETREKKRKILKRQKSSISYCEEVIGELENQVQYAERIIESLNISIKSVDQIEKSNHQFEALMKNEKKYFQSADISYFKFFAVEQLHNWVLAGSAESSFGLIFKGSLVQTSLKISFTIAENSKVNVDASRHPLPISTHSFFSECVVKTHPAVSDFVIKKMDLLCEDLRRIEISSPKNISSLIQFIELKLSRIDAASKELGHALDQCNNAYLQQSKKVIDAYEFTTYITNPSARERRLQVTFIIPDCYPFAPVTHELHPTSSSSNNDSITSHLTRTYNPAFGVLSRTMKSISQKINNL